MKAKSILRLLSQVEFNYLEITYKTLKIIKKDQQTNNSNKTLIEKQSLISFQWAPIWKQAFWQVEPSLHFMFKSASLVLVLEKPSKEEGRKHNSWYTDITTTPPFTSTSIKNVPMKTRATVFNQTDVFAVFQRQTHPQQNSQMLDKRYMCDAFT